jgi:UDP-N-acetylglucosamine 4,6-dehydratase
MSLDYLNTTVAITGGTGSFGQTVALRLLDLGVKEVRIISRDEAKQDAMRHNYSDPRLRFYLGDVRQIQSLAHALSGADVVFHAAALKQVPSCEFFPEQALQTNVLGSENVILQAHAQSVQKVVFLSTDKAVAPVNAMGMTKALMEKLVQAYARRLGDKGPVLCCVRYGNVLYSRGSVVPLFLERILQRRPLPVTVPEMTRFLLPLPQAVGLVELALQVAQTGDLLIRKSPAASIATLTTALQSLFDVDLPIETIGIRPGEKIHETLASAEELSRAFDLGDHLRIPMLEGTASPNNFAGTFMAGQEFSSANTQQLDVLQTQALLKAIPQVAQALGI